jgi:hypothetical protein
LLGHLPSRGFGLRKLREIAQQVKGRTTRRSGPTQRGILWREAAMSSKGEEGARTGGGRGLDGKSLRKMEVERRRMAKHVNVMADDSRSTPARSILWFTCDAVFPDRAVVVTAKTADELNHIPHAAAQILFRSRQIRLSGRCVRVRGSSRVQGSDQGKRRGLGQNTQTGKGGFERGGRGGG